MQINQLDVDHQHQYTEVRRKESHYFCCSLCGLMKEPQDMTIRELYEAWSK